MFSLKATDHYNLVISELNILNLYKKVFNNKTICLFMKNIYLNYFFEFIALVKWNSYSNWC